MTKGILGEKVGMTQVFTEAGELVPVTVVKVDPNVVLQVKTVESDGYEAVQLGAFDKRDSLANKPEQGHVKKAETAPKRFIREMRDVSLGEYEVGQEVTAELFEAGDIVDVTGTSKGKGYQGPIKRHGQARGRMSHGSHFHRKPGAMAGASDPGRVLKGKKLAGRMGGERITIKNLEIVKVLADDHCLLIKGNVPGAKKSYLEIRSAKSAQ